MGENRTISAGNSHSLVINAQGQVYSFGNNTSKQLGLSDVNVRNTFVPTLVPDISSAKSVAGGEEFSLVLTEQGQVYSFGKNNEGQLGLGFTSTNANPTMIPNLPVIKSLSHGASSVIDEQGQVWAFGINWDDRLGLGESEQILVPTIVPNLPPIKSAAHARNHSLFLDNDGNVFACGNNEHGQLGLGDRYSRSNPEIISNLPPIAKIAVGSTHSLVLTEDGRVYSFGNNSYGRLGLGDESEVGEGSFGGTWILTDRNRDVPVLIPRLPTIVDIAAGRDHSLLLDNQGNVYSFGRGNYGQLGYYPSLNTFSPTMIPNLSNIVKIACGDLFNLLLDNQGIVRSFGMNSQGQLGLGSWIGDQVFSPQIISGLVARLPSIQLESYITATYPVIRYLLDRTQGVDYTIRSSVDEDTILEFVFPDGSVYLSRVNYDPINDRIDTPVESEEDMYFAQLEQLIQNGQLTEFGFRPDLYQDEIGNQGFEYVTSPGKRYLIRVYSQDEQIYRALE